MPTRFRSALLWLAPVLLASPIVAVALQTAPVSNTVPNVTLPALKFATPNAARGAQISANCAGCHGVGGVSKDDAVPSLAGQVASFTRQQLVAFKAKLLPDPTMQNIAGRLSDQDMADIAAHFATLSPGPAWKGADAAVRAQGAALYATGDPARKLIACSVCHGAGGRGNDSLILPSIANLAPAYAEGKLAEYREVVPYAHPSPQAMHAAAQGLTDEELTALAAYVSSLK
ncbi:cytochrome c4 [Deinococcus sp. Arct2-2]|uniref:c-type cytochrome n=1 Tax=Deinococcus sp. Arct2-2 TaxID=2568653 RepID=UPI0010A51C07|nr:cytochrome c4 [Deinococcus sp. Arct2-2]THF68592.1 cytochrome c4 [Deinococcus sp. Arct2-2]